MNRDRAVMVLVMLVFAVPASAGDLVRGVRSKLSAGDLLSGAAAVEDYRARRGVDAEYLDAVGWLARGAEMQRRPDLANAWVAELHHEIPEERDSLLTPFGAAIEVEGRLLAARAGRGAALDYWNDALGRARDTGLRSRIRKNINLVALEGAAAPELVADTTLGPRLRSLSSLKGKPVLLFFWANWCGDCRAQSGALSRVYEKYRGRGLQLIAPTRLYGTGEQDRKVTPVEERALVQTVWARDYPALAEASVPIATENMVRYGASATPSFALVDRQGRVRFYSPTRLSEAELSARIEGVLAEAP